MSNNPDAANQYYAFMYGYRHRCGGKPLDPKFTKHTDPKMQAAYAAGWSAAQVNMNAASKWAQENYGFEPSIIRLMDFEQKADLDEAASSPEKTREIIARAVEKRGEENVRDLDEGLESTPVESARSIPAPVMAVTPARRALTPEQDPAMREAGIVFLKTVYPAAHITPAETDMFIEMLLGMSNKATAERMQISPETVRARRKRIYRKLDIAGNAKLMSKFSQFTLAQRTVA